MSMTPKPCLGALRAVILGIVIVQPFPRLPPKPTQHGGSGVKGGGLVFAELAQW